MPKSPQSQPANPRDTTLSETALRELYTECFDEYVYNDLPQYLIRVSDMRLLARTELGEVFGPLVDRIPLDLKRARETMEIYTLRGDRELKKSCKAKIKQLLKFAIFSHRWGAGEPTFRDMSSKIHGKRAAPQGPGYTKLLRFCEKAREYGCDFVWSDTCCINKESSAELDEAIRSMYRWYSDAFVCIVYLGKSSSVDDFPQEPWFRRGWTLQELLAPRMLRMFGKDWNPICPKAKDPVPSPGSDSADYPNDKESRSMLDAIAQVTGIEAETIKGSKAAIIRATVSQKMGWASKRRTTRLEDTAYSLLGIFDVTIPIAYGEGEMAFRKLLEAIAQRYQDITFFAWGGYCSPYSSALPGSPGSYELAASINSPFGGDTAFAVNKHGVQVKLLVIPVHFIPSSGDLYTLRPVDAGLARQLSIKGEFPEPLWGIHDDHAIGVVDYHEDGSVGSSFYGALLVGKRHFCVLMQVPWSMGSIGMVSWKIETGGILPMIEPQAKYEAEVQSICLRHYTPDIDE